MAKLHVRRHIVTQPQDSSYKLIPLTQNQNALVDTSDYEWLSQWNWCAAWNPRTKSYYARRKRVAMARQILDCDSKEKADHKNHNTLDNRRSNLRKASAVQNARNKIILSNNRSGWKGVTYHKRNRKWIAKIGINSKTLNLGSFSDRKTAARAYDIAAIKLYAEFAHLNFPLP